jgi:hypothetical protein
MTLVLGMGILVGMVALFALMVLSAADAPPGAD